MGAVEGPTDPAQANPKAQRAAPPYKSANEGLTEVRQEYLYWTGKLTEQSWQLSIALIGANWVVLGSSQRVFDSCWSQLSIFCAVLNLGIGLVVAWHMGDLHRVRFEYGEKNAVEWERLFREYTVEPSSWPFTEKINSWGKWSRGTRTWLPIAGGVLLVIAVATARP